MMDSDTTRALAQKILAIRDKHAASKTEMARYSVFMVTPRGYTHVTTLSAPTLHDACQQHVRAWHSRVSSCAALAAGATATTIAAGWWRAPMSEPIDPNKAVDFLLANAGKYARAKAERIHIEDYLYENTVINVKIAQRPKRSGLRRHFPHHCHERTSGMSTTHSTDICQPIPGWPEYQISKYGDVSRIAPRLRGRRWKKSQVADSKNRIREGFAVSWLG